MEKSGIRAIYKVKGEDISLKISLPIDKENAILIYKKLIEVAEAEGKVADVTEETEAESDVSEVSEGVEAEVEAVDITEEIASGATGIGNAIQPTKRPKTSIKKKKNIEDIYNFILGKGKEGTSIHEICNSLGIERKTIYSVIQTLKKKGKIESIEGERGRYRVINFEPASTSKVILPEEGDLQQKLSVCVKNEICFEILSYMLNKNKINVVQARNKFKLYEEYFCYVVRVLQSNGLITYIDNDEEMYNVKSYARFWYKLMRSNEPLTLEEIMEHSSSSEKDKIERSLKRAIRKRMIKIDKDGKYVAVIK